MDLSFTTFLGFLYVVHAGWIVIVPNIMELVMFRENFREELQCFCATGKINEGERPDLTI